MFSEALVIVTALLIILFILILLAPSVSNIIRIQPPSCPPAGGIQKQLKVLEDMNATAKPPVKQPVYTLFRNVPKDIVSTFEKRYLTQAVNIFSKGKLHLLDVENVDWMAENEDSPIVGLLDARVKVTGNHDVIRIIMMWCERDLWSVTLANAKGCFRPLEQAQCKGMIGVISNKTLQMPEYKVMKSLISRKQEFEWDSTGVLKTDPETNDSPMINTAYSTRPPEIFQNPTLPKQTGHQKLSQAMFFKTFGIPSS